jgi:hypothetical protein
MDNFIEWVSTHALTTILIVGTAFAIIYIFANRKALFYKE